MFRAIGPYWSRASTGVMCSYPDPIDDDGSKPTRENCFAIISFSAAEIIGVYCGCNGYTSAAFALLYCRCSAMLVWYNNLTLHSTKLIQKHGKQTMDQRC